LFSFSNSAKLLLKKTKKDFTLQRNHTTLHCKKKMCHVT